MIQGEMDCSISSACDATSIDALTYRQFNYAQMMIIGHSLRRWLHKQLSLKFTFASMITPFEMRYSTIKRDSALLDGYERSERL